MVRSRTHKLILYLGGPAEDPCWELYDLSADPDELENLAGRPEAADAEADLRAALCRRMTDTRRYVPPPRPTTW
jgi:hypothetical protein